MADVTILVVTYNLASLLERALNSAFDQTYSKANMEVLVVDDGSTDQTAEVIQKFSQICMLRQPHVGSVKASNHGFQNCRGQYVLKLDADDTLEKTAITELVGALRKSPEAVFAYSDYFEIDAASGKRKVVSLKENVFNSIAGGILFKTSVIRDFGCYDEHFFFAEYDLLIRLLKNHEGIYVPKPLYNYFRRPGSQSSNTQDVQKGLNQLREKHGDLPSIRKY